MPVIYTPKLSEVYRTTFFIIPSTFPGFISTGEVLVADGQGATVWQEITGTNVPIQTAFVANTTSTNQLRTNFISAGSIVFNAANVPVTNTNTISTGLFTTQPLSTLSLSTNSLSTNELTVLEFRGSSIQTDQVSTNLFQANQFNSAQVYSDFLSTSLLFTTLAQTSSPTVNTITVSSLEALSASFTTGSLSSILVEGARVDEVSTNSLVTNGLSTQILNISSINGASYPLDLSIPTDPQFSTVFLQNTLNTASILTTSVSANIIVVNAATISSIAAQALRATQATAEQAQFTNTNTNTIGAQSTIAYLVAGTQVNANLVSSSVLEAQTGTIQTIHTHSGAAQEVRTTSTLADTVYTNTISSGTAIGSSLQTNSLTAPLLSTGVATIPQVNVSSLQTGSLSTGSVVAPQSFITLATATNSVSTLAITASSISAATVFAPTGSTMEAFVSSLNGNPFPVAFSVNPDLVLSTITVQDTLTAESTLTSALSTGFLIAPLRTLSLLTDSISTGSVNASSALFSSGVVAIMNANTVASQDAQYSSTFLRGLVQVSTLEAQNIVTASLSSFAVSTGQLTTTASTEISELYANTLSTGTLVATSMNSLEVVATNIQSQFTNISTTNGLSLDTNTVSSGFITINDANVSTLNTNALETTHATIGNILQTTDLSANTISTAIITADSINTNTLGASTLSITFASMSTATATTATIQYLSAPTATYPLTMNATIVNTSTISSAVAYIEYGSATFLNASTFTFNELITSDGYFNYLTAIGISTGDLYMTDESDIIIANTMVVNSVSTNELSFTLGSVSSIQAAALLSYEDQHGLAIANEFCVDTLTADSLAINSVLANSTSTNRISTVTSEGGHAQIFTLQTNQVQVPSTLVSFISAGHVNADVISTHTITIWGPNTLLVQGTSILDGAIDQTGDLYIESLQTSTMSLAYIDTISSIQIGVAQISTVTSDIVTGSTLAVSTIQTESAQAQFANTAQLNTSTLYAEYISTRIFTVQAVYGSTLTLNSFTTISSISQVDTLTVDNLAADYLGVIETLSTTSMEISTLATDQFITSTVSVATVSTGSLEFVTFSLQALYVNELSTANLSTETVTVQSIVPDVIAAAEVASRLVRGSHLSTGALLTTTSRISSLVTEAISTTNLSTGILETGLAYFDTISANRLVVSGVYAQDARLSTTNVDFISAGLAIVRGGFSTSQLSVDTYSTGTTVLVGNGVITANTLSTNILSTGQVLGGDSSIFRSPNISTNELSTLEITTTFAITSTTLTNFLSAGAIYMSSYAISSLSANLVEANTLGANIVIRPTALNVNTISTGLFLANAVELTNLSTGTVSTVRAEFVSASIQSISTTTLTVTQALIADQAIFASVITDRISIGRVFTPTTFTVSSLSTNFISTGSISSAVANFDFVSTAGLSTTLRAIANGLFVNALSTGFLRAGVITASSLTYGDLRVSTINGQTVVGDVVLSGAANVTNMTVITNTQCITHSTMLLSTQYASVRGPTAIQIGSSYNRWVFGVEYNGGQGGSNRLSYSDNNGDTWTGATMTNVGEDNSFYRIIYNGEYYVATKRNNLGAGDNSTTSILKSINGINWTGALNGFGKFSGNQGAKGLFWNGRMWVAVGDEPTGNNTIKYSFNGSNWSNSQSISGVNPTGASNTDVGWNGNNWIVAGFPRLYTSSNGSNWNQNTSITGVVGSISSIRCITWAGKMWFMGCAVPTANSILNSIKYSYDGTNWSNIISGGFRQCYFIGWNGSMFIAVGEPGGPSSIQYSYDGSNWQNTNSSGFLTRGRCATWNGDYWMVSGARDSGVNGTVRSTIQLSYDGINYINRGPVSTDAGPPFSVNAVSYSVPYRPNVSVGNIDFYTQSVPAYYNNSHQIFTTTSTLTIDSFVFINRSTNQVLINAPQIPQSTASLIVGGQIGCSGEAFKPGGGSWTSPSDRRIKQDIQPANYDQCYNTMKNIPLYHYSYIDTYKATVTLRDQSVLGFIAQDVSNYFPKAVQVTSNLGFSDLLMLDPYQVQVLHYGATRHLMAMNEQQNVYISSFYTSTLANAAQYVSSVAETFITLEQEYGQLSTLMATEANQRHEAYESTIASHFVTISTMSSQYESLSTLIGERVSTITGERSSTITETEQAPSQPPQEEV